MKHIKYYIGEKQIKMFDDIEDLDGKEIPKDQNKIVQYYLDKRKGNKSKDNDDNNDIEKLFKSFKEAYDTLNNFNKFCKLMEYLEDDLGYTLLDEGSEFDLSFMLDDLLRKIISINRIDIINSDLFLKSFKGNGENMSDEEILETIMDAIEFDYIGLYDFTDIMKDFDVNFELDDKEYREFKYKLFYNTDEMESLTYFTRTNYMNGKEGCKLYRYMDIPDNSYGIDNIDWTNDGVGVYWSREIQSAQNYIGSGYNNYNGLILISSVECDDINWESTIFKTIYDLKYENEVELRIGATIDIVGFELSNSNPELLKIKMTEKEYLSKIGINKEDIENIIKNKYGYGVMLEEPIKVIT